MPSNYDLTTWKIDDERDITVPSGQKCRIRELTLEDMAELNIIDQMDTLGMLVQTEHIERVQGKKPQDRKKKSLTKAQIAAQEKRETLEVAKMLRDKRKFHAIVIMLDKVASTCVVEPVVESPWVPVDEDDPSKGDRKLSRSERLDIALYADKLPFEDKMAIFEEAFKGMGDLESFREGSPADVANVPDVEGSGEDAK